MTARPAAAAPPSPVLAFAGVAVVAILVAAISTLGLMALRPELGRGPSVPPPPSAPVSPSPSVDPSPDPTPSPSPRPSPTPSPTVAPTPRPTPSPLATPTPTPEPIGNVLPPCAYMDVFTPHHGIEDWPITLLDTIYRLPSSYAPADLVDSATAGVNGGYLLRHLLAEDLAAMAADARRAGAPIQLVSGYRSHAQQAATFDYWVGVGGYEQALRTSARAGHSEHQLGTAIDVTSEGGAAPWEYADWAATPAGAWMAANAWRYGFVMSYPRDAFDRTCYDYEPWHYRYVGRPMAAEIVASGLTAREVLWTRQ